MNRLLNIGCGGHFHPAWTNIDLVSSSPSVRAHDLRKGLPYADGSFDACYTSHVLEHLQPEAARASLREQFRALKSGGVVRVVVPDFEDKAREYLKKLDETLAGAPSAEADYDWMMLELLDQSVRSKTGGQMGDFILNPAARNAQYVINRLGDEAEDWFAVARGEAPKAPRRTLAGKIRSKGFGFFARTLRLKAAEAAVALFAGGAALAAFREGVFRSSGEIHLWMYDRFSLGRLLRQTGFRDARVCAFNESRIPDFNSYRLDAQADGRVRKADSLFMEAVKP